MGERKDGEHGPLSGCRSRTVSMMVSKVIPGWDSTSAADFMRPSIEFWYLVKGRAAGGGGAKEKGEIKGGIREERGGVDVPRTPASTKRGQEKHAAGAR
jgi:hypothetical protein